jgi:hypothetical protein
MSNELKDFIINPKSGRMIKINSRAYQKLVSQNVLKLEPSKDTVIAVCENSQKAQELQKTLNKKSIGTNKIVSRRGKKVISSNRRITNEELVNSVSSLAISAVNENQDIFYDRNLTDEEVSSQIKRLIHQKLIGVKPVLKPEIKSIIKQAEPKQKKKAKFILKPPQDSELTEEEVYSEDDTEYSE